MTFSQEFTPHFERMFAEFKGAGMVTESCVDISKIVE